MKKLLILFIVLSFNYSFAAVYTVTNTNDSGVGSLRDGIIAVNSGDTINFTLTYPATIPLSSGEINFGKSIYFDGPGADLLSISGGSSSRLFYITAGDVYFNNLTIRDGQETGGSAYGAGISTEFGVNLYISECKFTNHIQTSTVGGAILSGGYLFVEYSEFWNNVSEGGGAISVNAYRTADIQNSTFYNNSGGSGTGGAIRGFLGAQVNLTNCTITSNNSGAGGGLFVEGPDMPGQVSGANIINCTFSNNNASNYGNELGFFGMELPTVYLLNTIIHNDNGGNNFGNNANITSWGSNICSDGTLSTYLNLPSDMNNTSVVLAPLSNNGGLTQTMAIDCSSNAYNNGTVQGAPVLDQINQNRYQQIDIGAYEFQPEYGSETVVACLEFSSPSGNYVWTSNGIYNDTILSSQGCDSIITIDLTINTVNIDVIDLTTQLISQANGASYRWLDCDNAYAVIAGENTQSFTPVFNGSYAVEVADNNCVDTSGCYVISVIGLEELIQSEKELVKIVDFMGRETEYKRNTPLIFIYSDGTIERVMKLEE